MAKISMMLIQPTNGALLTESRRKNLRRRVRDERLTLPTLKRSEKRVKLSFWTTPMGRHASYKHYPLYFDTQAQLHIDHEDAEFKSKIYE